MTPPIFPEGDPVFPDGVDPTPILRPLRTPTWTDEGAAGIAYRRYITHKSPLLFLITYFGRRLRNDLTGQMSFCPFHLDACNRARRWPLRNEPQRHVDIAPREVGKSILYFEGFPTWALAHGHRRFFAAFSYTGDQSKTHYHDLVDIMSGKSRESELLLMDYPELRPIRGAGGPKMTVLQGGPDGRRAFAAFGLHESVHGLRMDEVRPDLLVGDDIDPGEAKYNAETKAKAVSAITEKILPLGRRAVVQVVGTVTARRSTIHDAVLTARGQLASSWVRDARFEAHHYPAILDEGLPTERSLWPTQWPLKDLLRHRYNADGSLNRAFALGMMNDPVRESEGAYWTEFRYQREGYVRRWVCWIDGALSTAPGADHTAYVVAGRLTTEKPAVVIAAADAGHFAPLEVRTRILPALRARFDGLQVFAEVNAFGTEENVRNQYGLVRGDQAPRSYASKALRIRAAADVSAEGLMVLHHDIPVLTEALDNYGVDSRDDLPDALAGALGVLLPGRIPQ